MSDRIMTKKDEQKYFTRKGSQKNKKSVCYGCHSLDCDTYCPIFDKHKG